MRLLHQIGNYILTKGLTIRDRLRRFQSSQVQQTEDACSDSDSCDGSGCKQAHTNGSGLDQTRVRQEAGSGLPQFHSPGTRTLLQPGNSTESNWYTIKRQRKREQPPPSRARWIFTVITGIDCGRQYVGITREIRIGRQLENHIQLRDPKVSRLHAVIHCRGAVLILEDHHSTNGTWINDCRITRKRLFPGDLIRVGETVIRVILN